MPAKPLQVLVDFARRNSPFYAELYRDVPQTVRDLTELPIIDQAEFWAANVWPDNRLLTGPLTDAGVYTSGGTTGAPKVSPWTRSEHADSVSAFGAGMVRAGLRPGHRVANLFFAGHLYGGFLYIEGALHNAPVENVRLPVAGHTPDEDVAVLIENFGVNVLAGTPMKLGGVAEAALAKGTETGSVELLLFAGDLLFDDLRPRLAKAFPGAAIASLGYATVDAGLVGGPVPGGDVRVHEAFPDRTVVELIDDVTGEPITEPGVRGRVVVTNLFRTLMPIIRYPVGDLAEWTDAECRRFRLVGRTIEGARVANVAMSYEEVHAALTAADRDGVMSGMQMVERRWDGKDGLILRLACAGEPPAGLGDRLVEAVYAARPLYPDCVEQGFVHPLAIEWVRPAGLATHPRTGKLIQVIDERPHA
ncbi:phenylacetate--CoA ligase family protein [Bailinhaonella thermotolerans]|uniref:Phenylacetate--CoA ligase family protein n=1 Tax=Bailinhaonella thermotolerans TaxID=1070861 RepID=A0A3A4B8S5_9ACTN|nr:phenylacetate--CoA ligase family protein [Bailinhaonella thermotolerans]RJL34084.1 phenylacetate--CoA ligase family protein [Bailinhaonella thermotolerans]